MAELRCSDYGYECDFTADGEMQQVIEKFRFHAEKEYGLEYSEEALMQIILRKIR